MSYIGVNKQWLAEHDAAIVRQAREEYAKELLDVSTFNKGTTHEGINVTILISKLKESLRAAKPQERKVPPGYERIDGTPRISFDGLNMGFDGVDSGKPENPHSPKYLKKIQHTGQPQ